MHSGASRALRVQVHREKVQLQREVISKTEELLQAHKDLAQMAAWMEGAQADADA
jgi:hypothetical protein